MAAESHKVTLYSNGYVYPEEKINSYGTISSSGLGAWVDPAGFTRVFFYPQHTGQISVALSVKAPSNANTLSVQLDSIGAQYNVEVPKSSSYATKLAGTFEITTMEYHYIEVKAITHYGAYLPDVEAVVVSGAAAAGLKYNSSEYRSAPATHLRYIVQGDSDIAFFYSEISIPKGADPLNAYYMANGFNDGYFGIQVNSPTERRVLFSIWSNYKTDKPEEIPPDYAVNLVAKGADVVSGSFGNEGAGGQSYWKFAWKTETTYKLLVHAERSGDHTLFTGYFFAPEANSWKLIAKWDKGKTGGKLLSGLHCFVENFGRNGNDYFKARYGNQWVYHSNAAWTEVTEAIFSTTASPTKHQRYDYGGGTDATWMYMYSGGFKEVNNLAPGSKVHRTGGGTWMRTPGSKVQCTGGGAHPAIDFDKLPAN